MPISDDIGLFLQNKGLGTLAPVGVAATTEDIFTEQQPDEPDALISVHRGPGLGSDYVMESALAAIQKPGLQVRIRGAPRGHVALEARAEAVRDAMDSLVDFTIGSNRYMRAVRLGDLNQLAEDSKFRRMYTVNFVVWQVAC